MFFGKIAKTTRFAVKIITPLIRMTESAGGLPTGFWEDPYVLGFLYGSVLASAQMVNQGKLKDVELGQVVLFTFRKVAKQNSRSVAERIRQLSKAQNDDFKKGIANADKVLCTAFGIAGYEKDGDVEEARGEA